jgi:hypothetical protein
MARENRFVILLDDAERQTIEALAKLEKMSASTLARRRLLFEAEMRGIFTKHGTKANRASEVVETPSATAA